MFPQKWLDARVFKEVALRGAIAHNVFDQSPSDNEGEIDGEGFDNAEYETLNKNDVDMEMEMDLG
jgi:hypothetical protein